MATQLLGTWRLVSLEVMDADGATTPPLGIDAKGSLVYSPGGYMCAALEAGPDCFAFSGRFEVRGDILLHYPDVAYMPTSLNLMPEHQIQLEGDRLTLTPQSVGGCATGRAVWERAF